MPEQHHSDQTRRGRQRPDVPGGEIHIDMGFGELFKGLGNFLELVGRMTEEGKSEFSSTKEVRSPSGVHGVYGFSVKMGLGGAPTVERFGNIRATPAGPEVSEVREPLVDVFDEGEYVLVLAELPGVTESDIRAEAKDDILTIAAESRNRKYAKEVLLPAEIDPASMRQTYQNGVLEIKLDKARQRGERQQ